MNASNSSRPWVSHQQYVIVTRAGSVRHEFGGCIWNSDPSLKLLDFSMQTPTSCTYARKQMMHWLFLMLTYRGDVSFIAFNTSFLVTTYGAGHTSNRFWNAYLTTSLVFPFVRYRTTAQFIWKTENQTFWHTISNFQPLHTVFKSNVNWSQTTGKWDLGTSNKLCYQY